MANDMYTFNLVANIDESKSNAEIQKYIDEIKSKVSMDEKSKIKINVTPIMDIVPDPNKAGEFIKVQKDLTTVTAQYTNQMGQSVTEVGKFKVAEDGATESIKKSNTYVSQAAGAQRNLVTEISAVIRRTLESAATLGVMYGALNQIRQGVQYIKDLNKEMVAIQMVTGDTDSQINALAGQYNVLAQSMSVSTKEIAAGSLEFVRQGKTAEETATLIQNSTMLSKLGNMDAAQSSEALTAIMNGFKLSAEETTSVVDKLVNNCQNI